MMIERTKAEEVKVGDWLVAGEGQALQVAEVEKVRGRGRLRIGFATGHYQYVNPSDDVQVLR